MMWRKKKLLDFVLNVVREEAVVGDGTNSWVWVVELVIVHGDVPLGEVSCVGVHHFVDEPWKRLMGPEKSNVVADITAKSCMNDGTIDPAVGGVERASKVWKAGWPVVGERWQGRRPVVGTARRPRVPAPMIPIVLLSATGGWEPWRRGARRTGGSPLVLLMWRKQQLLGGSDDVPGLPGDSLRTATQQGQGFLVILKPSLVGCLLV